MPLQPSPHFAVKQNRQLSTEDSALGVGEFFVTAVVAAIVNEFLGGGEIILRRFPRVKFLAKEKACAVEVDVRHAQPHRAAQGYVPSFIEVALRADAITIDLTPTCA
jgi:hypothetical protein